MDGSRSRTMHVGDFDIAASWGLAPGVRVVEQGFGVPSYRLGAFEVMPLRCQDLSSVLTCMRDGVSAETALASVGVPRSSWNAYVRALESMR